MALGDNKNVQKLPPDNSKILNELTYQKDVQDTRNYVPVLSVNIYEFMEHAYHGTHGFRDGSYIIPHIREEFYDNRRDLSFYQNYFQPILRAMVDPVFNEDVERTTTRNGEIVEIPMVEKFLYDIDNAGTPIHQFSETASIVARMQGIVYIVVDNIPKTEQPKTTQEALDNRILPYVYIKKAYQVERYKTNKFGRLEEIIFIEDSVMVKNEAGKLEEEKRYGRWNNMTYELLKKDKEDKDKDKFIILETKPHNLGVIPVIPYLMTKKTRVMDLNVSPPLYDIAKINHAVYNKSSEIRAQERDQAFAVFYAPANRAGDVTMGAKKVLWIPVEASTTPGFASPDPGIIDGLTQNNEKLIEGLYRIAGQNGVIGVQSAKSGIALEWEFEGVKSVLLMTSSRAKWLEDQIMDLFKLYTGEQFDYNAAYKDNFKPQNTPEDLSNYMTVLDMQFGQKGRALIKKASLMAISGKLDQEQVKDAIDEIDAEVTDLAQDAGNGDPDNPLVDSSAEAAKAVALNGAQVSSMVQIAQAVAKGEIPHESGIAVLMKAFNITKEEALRIIPANIKSKTVNPVGGAAE